MVEIYNRLGLYIHYHHRQVDCNQLGLCINGCISSSRLRSAQIVYRWMSTVVSTIDSTVGSMVGSMVGLTVGSTVSSTWLCWAINLSEAFDSSDKRLNGLVVLQTRFTGFVK
jgi:hypothetical protein